MKNNLTLVTGLFDIDRGNLADGFKRDFDHYLQCFERLLAVDMPMVIFCPPELNEFVNQRRDPEKTRIIKKSLDDIKNFPFFDQVQRIRNDETWLNRSGWIRESPQAKLELYNPLVMSKQFFLNDATIFNFFNTKYFMWIDAGISNTIGNPVDYFHSENFERKITSKLNRMTYICFPYDGDVEVHGFEKGRFDSIAGEKTERVARGGMFGGPTHAINEINAIYYQLLNETLNAGYMGTEESIFTLITYRNPELCNIEWIEGNGIISKFLNDVKSEDMPEPTEERLALYVLTFNLPEQFNLWAESLLEAFPEEYNKCKKYVINNSTDPKVDARYQELFEEHGFEEFKFNNIGICGGRYFAAQHFAESGHEFMVFFEDDMLLHTDPNGRCKSGFTTYHDDLFEKCIDIMINENLDYLKLCFTEFYGDNHENWAWYNVPKHKKEEYFPQKEDGSNPRSTVIHHTDSFKGLPYAVGEYHYCNWPLLFNKEGNQKVFLDTHFEHKYEQTWMSHVMNLIREGKVKSGCLLASVINHQRKYHYNGKERKENEYN